MRTSLLALPVVALFATTPVKASDVFNLSINGVMEGFTETILCDSGSNFDCPEQNGGHFRLEPFRSSFNLNLGHTPLQEGNNIIEFGNLWGTGGYSFTIHRAGRVLSGSSLSYMRTDSSYRFGAVGSSYDQASAASFNVVGGVPEPSSWAMLIFGFGLIGFGLRRNRRVRYDAICYQSIVRTGSC
jgi:hypothetical protein